MFNLAKETSVKTKQLAIRIHVSCGIGLNCSPIIEKYL